MSASTMPVALVVIALCSAGFVLSLPKIVVAAYRGGRAQVVRRSTVAMSLLIVGAGGCCRGWWSCSGRYRRPVTAVSTDVRVFFTCVANGISGRGWRCRFIVRGRETVRGC